MPGTFQPEDSYTISDLDTLKVVSDPLRVRLMEAMGQGPITVKGIAAKLGMSPKKLYYHINLLEEHGLIVVVDTQVVSGIIEKWYQLRALSFTVDKNLLAVMGDADQRRSGLDMVLDAVLGNTAADIRRALEQGLIEDQQRDPAEAEARRRSMFLQRHILHLDPAQRETFVERLKALIEEFDNV